jgi:hypothetical protein
MTHHHLKPLATWLTLVATWPLRAHSSARLCPENTEASAASQLFWLLIVSWPVLWHHRKALAQTAFSTADHHLDATSSSRPVEGCGLVDWSMAKNVWLHKPTAHWFTGRWLKTCGCTNLLHRLRSLWTGSLRTRTSKAYQPSQMMLPAPPAPFMHTQIGFAEPRAGLGSHHSCIGAQLSGSPPWPICSYACALESG